MSRTKHTEIVKVLGEAGRHDLARDYWRTVRNYAEAGTPASSLPPNVRDAWDQLQAAKQYRYPSDTISNLWRAFEHAAKRAGINPTSVTP
jgi:hypothetical protein